MAHNPDPDHANKLRLSLSNDEGHNWQSIYEFASGQGLPVGSMRYPALHADGQGGCIYPLPPNLNKA